MDLLAVAIEGAARVTVEVPYYGWTGTPGQSTSVESDGLSTRTNLSKMPVPLSTAALLANMGGGAATLSIEGTGGPAAGVSWGKATFTTAPTDKPNLTSTALAYYAAVSPGQEITASLDAIVSAASSWHAQIIWYTSGGATITSSVGPVTVLAAGQWTRLSCTGTAPATAASARVLFVCDQAAPFGVGGYMGMTRLLVELAPAPAGAYFDGDTDLVLTRTDGYGTNPVAGVAAGGGVQVIEDRGASVEGTSVVYTATIGGAVLTTAPLTIPGAWASTDTTMLGPLPTTIPGSSQEGDGVLWPLGRTDPVGVKRPLRKRTGTIEYLCPGDAQAKAVRDLYGEGADVTLRSAADSITHRPTKVDQRFEERVSGGPVWRVSVDYYEVAS